MELINIFFYIILSLFGLFLTNFMSKKFEFFDLPNKNKIHKIKTPNIGGIALILIILSNIFINDFNNDFYNNMCSYFYRFS